MIKGLPDVCGHERNTLYIIGNGFDIAHGILSKYKHFCCWLNLNGYEDYTDCLQRMFPNLNKRVDLLWSNFESALESMDYSYLYEQYVPFPKDNQNSEEWNKNIQSGGKYVKDIIENIPIRLKDWTEQINTNAEPCFRGLSPESKYLSFNYTHTLENVYHIPTQNVCHIHGSVKGDSKLIVGFDSPKFANNLPAHSDEEEKAQVLFVNSQNSLVKPRLQQIEKNQSFFDSMFDVDRIIVVGHSMAHVDLIYFCEVKRLVKGNAKWYFSKYTPEDIKRIMAFVKPARLQPSYIENYEICELNNLK